MVSKHPRRLILYLGFLNALTPFTIDLYLPAFGDIAADLNTTVASVQMTMATYFIGFALGQILYGPLLDRFGRKPPIYVGLALYIASSLGCAFAPSVEWLMFFRFLAALGGASASVGTVAMTRDFYPPEQSARVFSMLMLVLSASPLLAPTIGAAIAAASGWRTIFFTLTLMGLTNVGLVIFGLPTVYRPDTSIRLELIPVLKGFAAALKVRRFLSYTIAGSLSFAGLFVYLTGSPAIFMTGFGVSKQTYGAIFALLAVAMIGGGQLNNLLLKKRSSAFIFPRAVLAQAISAFAFTVMLFIAPPGLWVTVCALFVILLFTGIGFPNAAAMALSPFKTGIGSASSVMGFLQMGVGASLAALVGLLEFSGPATLPTAFTITLSASLSFLWLKLTAE